MTVHITNLYGMSPSSVAQMAQNVVSKIGCEDLNFKELGIYAYAYDWPDEPAQVRNARFDGILAPLAHGDTIIFQSPTWNSINWDMQFFDRLNIYHNLKKIIFIEDVVPLMFEPNKYLMPKFIEFYNRADLLIVPSQKLIDYLKTQGLQDKKYVVQRMWDHPCTVDNDVIPENTHIINFAGDPQKFTFVNDWDHEQTPLKVYSNQPENNPNKAISYTGWLKDPELIKMLRETGGFGLVWTDDPYTKEYMKMDATYKLSTYLAAGIPVIINSSLQAADLIIQKHLGLVVDSLNEASRTVENISDFEYQELIKNVESFGRLIRDGYFTKRALIEAVFNSRF